MIESPAQPRHAAELALIAGFIFLLIVEALFCPVDPPRRHAPGGPTQQAAAEAVPRMPMPPRSRP